MDLKTPFVDESTSLQKKIRLFVDVVVNNDLSMVNKDVFENRQFYTFELGGLIFLLYKEIEPSPHLINVYAFSEEVISKKIILEIRDSKDKLRLDFLHLANRVYSLHTGGLQEIEEHIIRINQMQILKRMNGCLSTEVTITRELMQMKRNASNDELIFCSSVLLGSTQEAQLTYDSFPEGLKEAYLEYPIYRLYKELVL